MASVVEGFVKNLVRLPVEVRRVRASLKKLDSVLHRLVPRLTEVIQNRMQPERARRRPRLTAKARASLVLQGRYMGFMRQLKPRQKALVRRIKESKGVRAAISSARSLAQR